MKLADPETDVVGDSSAWSRAEYVLYALAFMGIVAAFLLVSELGLWR